jgi:nitrate reductase NapAB chaperone NapD
VSFNLPVNTSKKLYRGDTIKIVATLTEGDSVQDLTDYDELYFTAKKTITDADDLAGTIQKTIGDGVTILDPESGRIEIVIEPSDTANNTDTVKYVCDIQGNIDSEIHTFDDGTMTISVDVTRAN